VAYAIFMVFSARFSQLFTQIDCGDSTRARLSSKRIVIISYTIYILYCVCDSMQSIDETGEKTKKNIVKTFHAFATFVRNDMIF
jgi:hypothetical protein